MKLVERTIEHLREAGYKIRGSVFKVDFNGTTYKVGFWVRAQNWNGNKYELPGFIGQARHKDFDTAVKLAIKNASEKGGTP